MGFIRIDPSLPIVWRSTRSIQIGDAPPRVILDPVTERDQRMLAAARSGVPSEGLAAVGRCTEASARAFLARIRPALASSAPPVLRTQVRVLGAERDEIVRAVRQLALVGPEPRGRDATRVGIIVADHAVPLRAYRDWLRDAVPHVAVVFGADAATVGPVVLPGTTGCLRCADLSRCDADAAWPAVAAQLVRMPAAAASDPVLRTEALCVAARLAAAVVRDPERARTGPGARLHADGTREDVRIEPHPDCGCRLNLQVPMPLSA